MSLRSACLYVCSDLPRFPLSGCCRGIGAPRRTVVSLVLLESLDDAMITKLLDSFYLSDDELRDSPSRRHGVDEETETRLRVYACEVIQEAVILLGLPQVTAATGQVFLHRFLCKRSVKTFHIKVRPLNDSPLLSSPCAGVQALESQLAKLTS